MAVIDKSRIIEAIQQTEDERILFAINRLLQIEEEIPAWHKEVLEQRLKNIEDGGGSFQNWKDAKDSIFKR